MKYREGGGKDLVRCEEVDAVAEDRNRSRKGPKMEGIQVAFKAKLWATSRTRHD